MNSKDKFQATQRQKRVLLPRRTALFCFCLWIALVSGCSGEVRRAVSAEFSDKNGLFDGAWLAKMLETPPLQIIQNWRVSCQTFKQTIPLSVEKGRLTTRINDQDYTTYLSRNGRFRLEIPTAMRMSQPGGSDGALANGRVTLILQGDLRRKPPNGQFTFGVADFANAGCTTQVSYELLEEETKELDTN